MPRAALLIPYFEGLFLFELCNCFVTSFLVREAYSDLRWQIKAVGLESCSLKPV